LRVPAIGWSPGGKELVFDSMELTLDSKELTLESCVFDSPQDQKKLNIRVGKIMKYIICNRTSPLVDAFAGAPGEPP
jgi:hypothetical protein